ncbi:MAG: hypothetical protein ACU843_15365, partial [Gammaproteobacteria bacterium]
MAEPPTERHQLDEAIAALEGQRGQLGDAVVDAAIVALRAQYGAIAAGENASAVGARGVGIGGDSSGAINTGTQLSAAEGAQLVYAEHGATVVIGDAQVAITA